MDSSEDNPTLTLESLKTSIDDASQEMQGATQLSEMSATNLSNLTLNPSIKLPYLPEYSSQPTGQLPSEKTPSRQREVRTLLSEQRYRMQKLIESLRLRYAKGVPRSDSQRELQQQEDTEIRSRVRRFQCTCNYCQFKRNPSDDNYENYYNTTYSNYATESQHSEN
ncbi:developmental pluripotency-associated protein 3-like, partial [Moschus berezovskii]|uniref:developmental pluripotency-associated protein 3-like n=1 Tax=Moschus berezovskii TaxID=68408 RepID=UPI0024452A89